MKNCVSLDEDVFYGGTHFCASGVGGRAEARPSRGGTYRTPETLVKTLKLAPFWAGTFPRDEYGGVE